ncbi:flagellar motor protein MotS [Virgibacillus profundi]|uniref:Flagellar motor protein MotS n=1 Tax=Virgibacillus profundi TaxID=2024555 RepID=A0A2A2IG70_9BACI|nr:flagellar motor protein MotS [Virgibacillus profundi]PAV30130.1 flagellar motor protein MotS [Virgibacillus profundi]PXY54302.1 flagellar motor protein MotS [Virgibacillus profundi]
MKRREIKRSKSGGAPKWMVTYSDMVTLILVFFILLFSMSQIDLVKFDAVSESFKNRMIFDFFPSPVPMENPTESTSHMESGKNSNEFETPTQLDDINDRDEKDSLNNLMDDVESYLDENGLNNVISASRTERGVVLVLQELILFEPGKAELLPSGEPFLSKVGSLLSDIPNKVKVEGHTDSRPMSTYKFPSNWELSGARAGSVVRYLISENDFDESRFTIVGYSDTRPLVPNTNPGNMSQNRRVEIVVLENTEETEE